MGNSSSRTKVMGKPPRVRGWTRMNHKNSSATERYLGGTQVKEVNGTRRLTRNSTLQPMLLRRWGLRAWMSPLPNPYCNCQRGWFPFIHRYSKDIDGRPHGAVCSQNEHRKRARADEFQGLLFRFLSPIIIRNYKYCYLRPKLLLFNCVKVLSIFL